MTDAIARAGGLQDDRANPSAVFLFRFEKPALLGRFGVRTAQYAGAEVPTVYRVDLLNPVSTKGLRNLDGFGHISTVGGDQVVRTSVDGAKKTRTASKKKKK